MARGRMISKSLSTSEKFAAITGHLVEFCHALYPLLIPHTDDFGRLQGDPFTVKHQCYPASQRTLDEFADGLLELHRVELIQWYVVGGKRFIQIQNFEPHQLGGLRKRTQSRFPEVPGSSGKVQDIPVQEKRREGKRSEEKRTNTHTPRAASASLERVQTVLRNAEALRETVTARRVELKAQIAALRVGFDAFWTVYPKKVGKDKAWTAWQHRHPTDELAAAVLAALAWQVHQALWLREGGRYVPNPATWINQGRWQDEPSTTPRINDRTLAAMAATKEFLDS